MIKRIVFFFIVALNWQCSDKEVLLPVISVDGIPQVENHSSIWIFYDPAGQDSQAVLNKNNKLLNTNWIFNIDRRLKMTDVIPLLEKMQDDRNKDSMHKKEGMKNFFSYADNKNQRISLVSFPQTAFVKVDDLSNRTNIERDSCATKVWVYEDEIRVNGKSFAMDQIDEVQLFSESCTDEANRFLQLVYQEGLSFQSYLEVKAQLALTPIPVDTIELIETLK
jgi:hypothetical protein